MKLLTFIIVFSFLIVLPGCKELRGSNVTATKIAASENGLIPETQGGVSDYSNILSPEEEEVLSTKLSQYARKTAREIVIVTTNTIAPFDNIQRYATEIGQTWGIGDKEKDNGLVIVLNITHRNVGIATGLGTEKILTDWYCKKLIDSILIPEFRNEKYFVGLDKSLDKIIKDWK